MRHASDGHARPSEDPKAGTPSSPGVSKPYFHVRATTAGIDATGAAECRLGHRLDRDDGQGADGVFASWRWDGRSLSLEGDRYGCYPLYYFGDGTEICVSSSLERLLAQGAPLEIDEPAVAVFLRFGFFVGEDTPFKAIRALPPGARLAWSPGQLDLHGGRPAVAPANPSRDVATDEYIGRFRAAMERRRPPDEPYILPLSGGRDSRHILLELSRMGCPPGLCLTTFRYPPTSPEDEVIAPQLAEALNLPHRFYVDREARFRRESAANLEQNLCADEGAWVWGLYSYLKERAAVIYDGLAGDILSAGQYLTRTGLALAEGGRLEELALHLIAEWHKDVDLDAFLSPAQRRRFSRERAVARIVRELGAHRDAANPIASFYFFNRTRREMVLPAALVLEGLDALHFPYLDRDVCDFLLSLPPGLTFGQDFHSETIVRAFPEYAHIPFERKDAPRVRDLAAYAHRLRYFVDLVICAQRLGWWSLNDGLLRRAVAGHFHPRRAKGASRFLPTVLYLSQLEALARGRPAAP